MAGNKEEDLIREAISVGWTVRNPSSASEAPSKNAPISAALGDTRITKEIGRGTAVWSISEARLVQVVEPDGHRDDDPYGRADWYKIISQVALRGNAAIRRACAKRYDAATLRDNLQRIAPAEIELERKEKAEARTTS